MLLSRDGDLTGDGKVGCVFEAELFVFISEASGGIGAAAGNLGGT